MWFFRDISISYKTLVPPIVMMIALGSVLFFTIRGFDKQEGVIRRVNEIALERSALLNRFILLSERVQSDVFLVSVMRLMGVPDGKVVPVHNQLEEGLSNLGFMYHQILNEWPLDATERETLKQMKAPLDGFRKQARQATDAVFKNPSFGILLVRSAAFPFARFRKLLTRFLDYQKDKIVQAETAAKQTTDTVKTTATAIALFTAFMAILITVWISTRLISRPVRSITNVMGQLADGNLSAEVGDLRRRDEIGAMAKAVEVFRENAIEKQAAEEALRKERDRAQMYLNIAGVMFVVINVEGEVTLINKKGCEILGYDEGEIVGKNWFDNFLYTDDKETVKGVFDQLISGDIEHVEYVEKNILNKNGQSRFIAWHNTILQDEEGNIIGTLSSGEDITEQKEAEKKIKASLEEKDVLLREIHHRVKNNMQVVISLLRLQSEKIKDKQYADMFQESQERIKSMALIHEKLYQSKDLVRIDFNEYIKSLMNGLFRSHGIDPGRIVTKLKVEDVSLGLDHALPCGLIINELVSNSLKYAFPEDRKGEISVTLRSITEDKIELIVSDDGIGIPEDLDFKNTAGSLGLDLVTILAEHQLGGKIELKRAGGTRFSITFTAETVKARI